MNQSSTVGGEGVEVEEGKKNNNNKLSSNQEKTLNC